VNIVDSTDLAFDLKKPCDDCPFTKNAKMHEGVVQDLIPQIKLMEEGRFMHSCHKTDPRADHGRETPPNGSIQHCAGVLLMMKKNPDLLGKGQCMAIFQKKWKPDLMSKDAEKNAFESLGELAAHYFDLLVEYKKKKFGAKE
jgi:hypothetical protein